MEKEENGMIDIFWKKNSTSAVIPYKKHEDDVGYDLYSDEGERIIYPGCTLAIETNIALQVKFLDAEDDKKFKIEPKIEDCSGNAFVLGLTVIGGTIDPNYIGSIKVILANVSSSAVKIKSFSKIAQIVFHVTAKVHTEHVLADDEMFEKTDRGADGFGSTGIAGSK